MADLLFEPPFGGLRGNVRTSSTARWKVCRRPIFGCLLLIMAKAGTGRLHVVGTNSEVGLVNPAGRAVNAAAENSLHWRADFVLCVYAAAVGRPRTSANSNLESCLFNHRPCQTRVLSSRRRHSASRCAYTAKFRRKVTFNWKYIAAQDGVLQNTNWLV